MGALPGHSTVAEGCLNFIIEVFTHGEAEVEEVDGEQAGVGREGDGEEISHSSAIPLYLDNFVLFFCEIFYKASLDF